MDSKTARWLQLKRFSDDEIAEIHARELKAEERRKAFVAADKSFDLWCDWRSVTGDLFAKFNSKYGPLWSKGKSEEERSTEIAEFERNIYTIWAPIFQSDIAEIEKYHQADRAIVRDDYFINFAAGGVAAQKKLSRVWSGDGPGSYEGA